MQNRMENQADSHGIAGFGLLAVTAQPIQIEDSHPAIFEPEQPLFFQPIQALVGVLPRDA